MHCVRTELWLQVGVYAGTLEGLDAHLTQCQYKTGDSSRLRASGIPVYLSSSILPIQNCDVSYGCCKYTNLPEYASYVRTGDHRLVVSSIGVGYTSVLYTLNYVQKCDVSYGC